MPIDRIKLPDNTVHELRDPRVGNARIFYGTCASAASAVEKVVVCPDFTADELVKGAAILVTFDNTSTAAVADVKMNVNSTGAFKINKIYNNAYGNLTYPGDLRANMTHLFVFSGGSTWIVCGLDYNANITYSAMTQAQADDGTSTTGYRISPAVLQTKILNMLEANQADWKETDTESPSYIQNKPDIADITPELKEDQTFTTRGTGGNATVAKITTIKGNTLVWNQLAPNSASEGGWLYFVGLSGEYVDGVLELTVQAQGNYLRCSRRTNIHIIGHKLLIKYDVKSSSAFTETYYGIGSLSNNNSVGGNKIRFGSVTTDWQTRSGIVTNNDGKNWIGIVLNMPAEQYVEGMKIYLRNIIIIDLTYTFGYGNEPVTVEEFESLYPSSYYNRNDVHVGGTLINNSASGLQTTDANDNVIGTLPLNLTTITGKLNGTGESVVVFPEGLRSAGTKYDEISADGKTAIVRIEKVVLTGTESYAMENTNYIGDNSADVYIAACSGTRNGDVCSNIFYVRSDVSIWFSDLPYAIRANSGNQIHFRIPNSATGITNGSETTASAIAKIKSYIQGEYENETPIIIYRPLATPLVYTLDTPVSLGYKCDSDGKEIRLPVDTASNVNAPFRADIQYGVNGGDLIDIINSKQDALVSGINIKTINNQTLLGSGDIEIETTESLTTSEIDTIWNNAS